MAKNWRKAGEASNVLGRGLAANTADLLFGDAGGLRDTVALRLADIVPNPDQPRRFFDHDELTHLADSMRAVGQLAPVLVKPHPRESKRFILVAGERRWRAAGIAELPTVSAHILSDDSDAEQIALIENLQRVNLSPVEEAEGVQRLVERHGYSQEHAGSLLGRSRTEINTTLSLLRLHPTIRAACVDTHTDLSKALLLELARMPMDEQLSAWAEIGKGVTVRQLRAARRGTADGDAGAPRTPRRVHALARLERALDDGLDVLESDDPSVRMAERGRLPVLRVKLEACISLIDALLKDED